MTFPPLMMLKEPRSAPVPSSLATIKYPTNTLPFSAVIVTGKEREYPHLHSQTKVFQQRVIFVIIVFHDSCQTL